jgi:hypothetical protein
MKKLSCLVAVGAMAAMLSGCAATQTALSHKDLKVQTKMSETVFLDPVGPAERTVFVQARNTSDQPAFSLDQELRGAIAAKGYQIVNDPKQAHYLLQVNVLSVGKADPSAAEKALGGGFGSALGGAAAGAAVGYMASGGGTNGALIGGLVAGGASMIADSLVKDVTYAIITDIQISEKSQVKVFQNTKSRLKQGTATTKEQTAVETVDKKSYQTRILSEANQVNLELQDALPQLKAGLVNSISGLF